MKTIETTVYNFNELSDKAKEKAREWYRNTNQDYNWSDESLASLKALANHFGGELKDYSIEWHQNSPSDATFSMPEMEASEIESKLSALGSFNPETLQGHGDCKLTGFCADESAIDGFRKAWHTGERNLEKLMDAAFESWLTDAQAECTAQFEDESVDESIIANEYTFTENGKRF